MTQRRPSHKSAHSPCPRGQTSWADCDVSYERRFGHCRAVVGRYEPAACARWAFEDGGYCTQHHVSRVEAEKSAARAAIVKTDLDERITAYIAMSQKHPSIWDSRKTPSGVIPVGVTRPRKGPYRLPTAPRL